MNFCLHVHVDANSFKLSRGNRSHVSSEEGPTAGQKKSVIGVVLREDEILPGHSKINVSLLVFTFLPKVDIKKKVLLLNSTGVSKMVPIEDSSKTETVAIEAQHQVSISIEFSLIVY